MELQQSAGELRSTLEYYLSNDNLQKDQYFAELVRSEEDGFIPIKHFLVCPKIRRLRAGRLDIRKAVEESDVLAMNDKGDMVRRLKPYRAVREKRSDAKKARVSRVKQLVSSKAKSGLANEPKAPPAAEELQDHFVTAEQGKASKKPFHVVTLTIESDSPLVGERVYPVLEAIREKVVISPLYIRFDSTSGHLVFERDSISAANLKVPGDNSAPDRAGLPAGPQQADRPPRECRRAARVLAPAQRALRAHLQQEYAAVSRVRHRRLRHHNFGRV